MSVYDRQAAVVAHRSGQPRRIDRGELALGLLLVLPALVLTVGIIAYPVGYEALLSLTDERIGQTGTFVGMANYRDLLVDRQYWEAVATTIGYVAATSTMKLVLGLTMALALARSFRGRPLVFVVLLLPWLYPASLAATSLQWMLNPAMYGGVILQLDRVDHALSIWLEASWPLIRIVAIDVWRGTSFVGVFLVVGLNAIATDLFEFAALEGGGALGVFRLVTLPLLRRAIFLALILSLGATLADFTNLYLLTGGRETTHIVGTLAYDIALTRGEVGRGAAISLSIAPMVALLGVALIRLLEGEEN